MSGCILQDLPAMESRHAQSAVPVFLLPVAWLPRCPSRYADSRAVLSTFVDSPNRGKTHFPAPQAWWELHSSQAELSALSCFI